MNLVVNGRPLEVESRLTAAGLLDRLQVRRDAVAVEVNRRVVPRAALPETPLADGDRVEIVSFTGGG